MFAPVKSVKCDNIVMLNHLVLYISIENRAMPAIIMVSFI